MGNSEVFGLFPAFQWEMAFHNSISKPYTDDGILGTSVMISTHQMQDIFSHARATPRIPSMICLRGTM